MYKIRQTGLIGLEIKGVQDQVVQDHQLIILLEQTVVVICIQRHHVPGGKEMLQG